MLSDAYNENFHIMPFQRAFEICYLYISLGVVYSVAHEKKSSFLIVLELFYSLEIFLKTHGTSNSYLMIRGGWGVLTDPLKLVA